jgi:hypothetical protein
MEQTLDELDFEIAFKKSFWSGFKIGFEKGQREMVLELLKAWFGPLPDSVRNRLDALPAGQLVPLATAALSATSLKELGLTDD